MQEVFSNMGRLGQIRTGRSYLNVMNIETGEIEVLASFDKVIEAPNWLKKTDELVYNSEGHLYAFKLADKSIRPIETGECDRCNNDHVLAPDESGVAVSHSPITKEGWSSRVYTVPFETGIAKLITPKSPSFLHGWSPDGKDLAYCAFRQVDGELHVDVYTAPADGSGEEVRLTSEGFNDGPEYSPDGEYIWFISTRTGLMQVWRMRKDGSEQTQMTFNEQNNWFGHVSPDGEKVVYLSYHKGHLSPNEHLPNMQVELWLMNSDGSDQHRICSFFGGQGSINVNSWAADSKRFAFVSYDMEDLKK
ncbi:MAG: TolB family protein [Firmicutes bacterium]|nr:TolB family protein [Bacillota bacterium]